MAELPDELWGRIVEMGVSPSNPNPNYQNRFSFKDLCRISICSRRLHHLSNDDSLWSSLLSSDFPAHSTNPSSSISKSNSFKSRYQLRYEKDKARRVAAHRRTVLRIESRIEEYSRRIRELQDRGVEEGDKIKGLASELSNLHKVRQASVALNVWQPEVIRGRQKQIVEQCAVPLDSRINALEMELKLCKQQIIIFEKAHRDEKQRLEVAREQLSSMKYHPLQDDLVIERSVGDRSIKRKKLKRYSNVRDNKSCRMS